MKKLSPVIALLFLTSCEVGPDYVRPDAPVTDAYKEAPQQAADGTDWTPAAPSDAVTKGNWWEIYNDPVLNDLEMQVDVSNQNLKEAEAAYRYAQAEVAAARAEFFPTISTSGSQQFSQSGGYGRGGGVISGGSTTVVSPAGSSQGGTVTQGSTVQSVGANGVTRQYTLSADASWTIDVWGRIRRQVESTVANAEASAADLANAKLSAEGTLATDYFELRIEDELKTVLDNTVEAYRKSLEITQNQYNSGVAAKVDLITARTQLEGAETQQINVGVARAQLEHAIAVLIGKPPGAFSLAPQKLNITLPDVPTGVPSALLQRRPDIAAAERTMEAANAEVGVAVAAYYPDLTLSGSYGFSGENLSHLVEAANHYWSVGPELAETVFDAGARSAEVEEARATYDQDVAAYRQTVLTAFEQVEDNLAAERILAQQQGIQQAAVTDAEQAVKLTLNQYKAGIIVYTNVVVAQETALADEEAALDTTALPTRQKIEDDPASNDWIPFN
jgi:NodT family efflux transporter outer membrane factor (OMF) lipoprotein